jgi:hypothetical protein
VFQYYKEFLNDTCPPGVSAAACSPLGDEVLSQPPQPFNCRVPPRWRNKNCGAGATSTDPIASQGTELDWLGFYMNWRWGPVDPEKNSNVVEMADTYVAACGGVACSGLAQVTYETMPGSGGLRPSAQNVLGAGNPSAPKFLHFVSAASANGVTTDLAP